MSWLWVGDLGVIKPYVEDWVSETTGRELAIGKLSIDLGPRIIVVAEDITFANAEWASPDHMVSVGRVSVGIVTSSLWNSPIVVEGLSISNATINLTERQDAEPNWALELPPSETVEPPPADDARIPLLLRNASIQNVELVYVSPGRDGPVELVVNSFTQHVREDDFLDLHVKGTLSGRDFRVDGEGGTWEALLTGRDVRYKIDGQFDTLTISSEGEIDDLFAPVAPSIRFSAEGPALDDLTEMLALGNEGSGDISVSGNLALQSDDQMLLDVTGNVGQTKIESKLSFADLTDFSTIDADVRVSGPDLGRILSIAGVSGVRKAPFLLIADVHRENEQLKVEKAEMVFGETRFLATADLPKFPGLDDASLTLNVHGPDIARFRYLTGLPGTATGAFSIDASLAADADQREFYELAMETSHGKLSANGEIKGAETFLGSTARLELELFDLAAFASAWELDIGDLPSDAIRASGAIEYVDGGIRTDGPVSVSLGPLDASADGMIAFAAGAAGTNLMFEVASDELRYVTRPWTDTPFVPPESVSLSGQLRVQSGSLRVTDVTGKLGNDEVTGEATIVLAPGIAGSSIRAAIKGDATEELFVDVPDIKMRPGPFDVSGRISFGEDALTFDDLRFQRPSGELSGTFRLGLPVERQWMHARLRGSGDDVRTLLGAVNDVEVAEVPFSLVFAGGRNGDTFTIENLDFTMADAKLNASGTIELGQQIDRTRFNLAFDAPNLASLGTVGGRRLNDQPFSFEGTLSGHPGQIRIENAQIAFGDSSGTGRVTYRLGDTPYLEVSLDSDRLAFEPLFVAEPEGAEPEPREPPADGRVIPDVPLPLDALASIDAQVDVRIGKFRRGPLYLRDVVLNAQVDDGALRVRDLSFHARSGFLRAKAALEPEDGTGQFALRMIARELAFGMREMNADLEMTGDLEVSLDGTGNDLRTLLSSMHGVVLLELTGGRVQNNRAMGLFYGDAIGEILTTINPFLESDPVTEFDCFVAPLVVDDGKLQTEPAAFMRTDKLNMVIKPEINLKNEKIDISVRTTPRKILSISAGELVNPYVKIIGTMAKPALAVDEQGVLISGGAAVATGGISLLAKAAFDRLSKTGKPCQTAHDQAIKALSSQFPDIVDLQRLPKEPVAQNP